ncbi:MAG: lysophospholipid acyltransferase family protein [Candidatus Methylomirabilales bacterium]
MAKLTTTDFKPAKPWRWLIALAAPLNRALIGGHTTLDVRPADLTVLRRLPPGCLIAPNHSHHYDAQVTFELARQAGRRVIFMATRELFDAWGGLGGWFLQRLAVFSVNRGGTNDEARGFARMVLVTGTSDLLMFPEGEVYLLNDLVMPLKPGVARLALEAAEELRTEGRQRPIFIVPVAIKYRYTEDITAALESLTARLESHVLGQPSVGPLYPRIIAIGTELLAQKERVYGVTAVPGEGLFQRIRRLRQSLLEQLERKHLGEVQEGFDFDRARKLMIRIQGSLLAAVGSGGYYGPPTAQSEDPLAADLEAARLCAKSVAFPEDYLLQDPTPERMAETLIKLEREVLGTETRTFGRRQAVTRIAPPLDVHEYLPQYATSPDDTIEAVVIRLHETLQAALDAIPPEGDTGANRYQHEQ